MNTNWSSPKTNIIAGINDLRKALASGHSARLIRAWNEECSHPITVKNYITDLRCYQFSIGYGSTANQIKNDTRMSDFEKELSLNYVSCFGDPDAVEKYYKTGVLTKRNVRSMGVSHLVKATDLIKFYEEIKDVQRANLYRTQYATANTADNSYFYDFFQLKNGYHNYNTKHFKHKLWVVELLDEKKRVKIPMWAAILIAVMNVLLYPVKYIPQKSTLRMPEYTCHTFRVGSVVNGFEVEFQIPKKFSFR
jgi:hypothetical protein